MDKYLLVLAGLPRGGEQTWKTIFKHVINPLQADLAICTGTDIDKSSILYKKSKYKWLFEEYDDWFNYYEENFSGYWREVFDTGLDTGLYNSGSVHFAIKDIVKKNYIEIIKKYDYIIYSRFDQFYIKNHPEFSGDNIWIPQGENYTGMCDRHALFPSKFAEDFLDICNFIDSKIFDYDIPEYLNCEAVYKMHLNHIGLTSKIKRNKRFQFTTAKKNDFTRWRVPKFNLHFYYGVKIKYPNEFILSVNTLMTKKNLFVIFQNIRVFINYFYLQSRIYIGKFIRNYILK